MWKVLFNSYVCSLVYFAQIMVKSVNNRQIDAAGKHVGTDEKQNITK